MTEATAVLKNFQIKGAIESVALFGGGHINDSYLVKTTGYQYLLQRINTDVFQHPQILESNLKRLFKTKSEVFIEHLTTKTGDWLYGDESGVWKMQLYAVEAYAPEKMDTTAQVSQVGVGFGQFTAIGFELLTNHFKEPIADFHDLNWRLQQLDTAVENDTAGRKEEAGQLIEQANSCRWIAEKMKELKEKGLPLRLCHNDTKIGNILLSRATHEFKYVIDLDTVGPGYVLYDFGDMMRTLLSPTKEAEPDVSKIILSQDYYQALKKSYLSQCGNKLTALEINSLAFGGQYMTYLMAIRFLADFLNGDTYYKVSYPQENFIRARNQLRLLQLMDIFSA